MNYRFKVIEPNQLPAEARLDTSLTSWDPSGFDYIFNRADCLEGWDLIQVVPAQQHRQMMLVYRRRGE